MDLKLRFCESEIGYWANLYTERQREKNRVIETELIDLKSDIVKRGHMTRVELNKLARWKSYRRAGLTLENTEDFVTEITKQAFTATDDSEKLLSLTKLQGIGQPTASAILSLIYTLFGVWVLNGERGGHIRFGRNILNSVATLRTEQT